LRPGGHTYSQNAATPADILLRLASDPVPDVRDITRAILLSPVFEELDKRSLLANIIKLYPEVQAMVAAVEQSFGSVDILVNNAGWVIDRLFVEKPRSEWEKEVQVNLWGMINCTRAVLDGMISRSSGVVVSIASDAARIGEFREGVYGACKAGVIALSKTLARENGRHNIRFNVVCPGTTLPAPGEDIGPTSLWASDEMKVWLQDDMRSRIGKAYPLRRVGTPADIAPAVLFLASDVASFVTGQTLSVSGGYTMV